AWLRFSARLATSAWPISPLAPVIRTTGFRTLSIILVPMDYRAVFKCISGCPGEYDLEQAIYRCPVCGDLLEVVHNLDALRQHSADEWKKRFDDRYKRTEWPYGS